MAGRVATDLLCLRTANGPSLIKHTTFENKQKLEMNAKVNTLLRIEFDISINYQRSNLCIYLIETYTHNSNCFINTMTITTSSS